MVDTPKIVVFGECGSGKSNCVIRFTQGIFVNEYDSTIEDVFRKYVVINNKDYIVEIVDTAGIEEYTTIIYEQWMKKSEGFILLFALNSRESFDKISEFYNRLCKVKDTTDIPLVLMANKCDLENEIQVPTEDIEELANIMNCTYYIASAKENININEVFWIVLHKY